MSLRKKVEARPKVIVIGIDGCTFDLIMPWIKENKLPTINEMMKNGVHGILKSTIPPQSPPAWTSAVTGKNPGKHGIFDFYTMENYKKRIISRMNRRCKAIWNIISENDKKVCVINVPITYPPETVNGIVVSGMFTPSFESNFTYPNTLKEELLKIVGRFEQGIDRLKFLKGDAASLIKVVCDSTEKLRKITLHLLKNKNWDFAIVVFRGSDTLQHQFWKYIDPIHPLYDPIESEKFRNAIFNYYQRLDEIIREILSNINNNTYILLMSDHGFEPKYKEIHINNFLSDIGILRLKVNFLKRIRLLLARLGFSYENILNLANSFGLLRLAKFLPINVISGIERMLPEKYGTIYDIDWSKTKAYLPSNTGQGIIINLKGRETNGIVEPREEYENLRNFIINRLYNLKDPEDGTKVISNLYKREECYIGKYFMNAPDILINPHHYYIIQNDFNRETIMRVKKSLKFRKRSADHNMNGILIISGKNIKKGKKIKNIHIVDIMPTILYILDIKITEDIDGKILKEIFYEKK